MNRQLENFRNDLVTVRRDYLQGISQNVTRCDTEMTAANTQLGAYRRDLVAKAGLIDNLGSVTDIFAATEFLTWWNHPLVRDIKIDGNHMELHTETIFIPHGRSFWRVGRFIFKFSLGSRNSGFQFVVPADDPDKNRSVPNGTVVHNCMHPHITGNPASTSICWGRVDRSRDTISVLSNLVQTHSVGAIFRLIINYLQTYYAASPYRRINDPEHAMPTVNRTERNRILNEALERRGLPPLTENQKSLDTF